MNIDQILQDQYETKGKKSVPGAAASGEAIVTSGSGLAIQNLEPDVLRQNGNDVGETEKHQEIQTKSVSGQIDFNRKIDHKPDVSQMLTSGYSPVDLGARPWLIGIQDTRTSLSPSHSPPVKCGNEVSLPQHDYQERKFQLSSAAHGQVTRPSAFTPVRDPPFPSYRYQELPGLAKLDLDQIPMRQNCLSSPQGVDSSAMIGDRPKVVGLGDGSIHAIHSDVTSGDNCLADSCSGCRDPEPMGAVFFHGMASLPFPVGLSGLCEYIGTSELRLTARLI